MGKQSFEVLVKGRLIAFDRHEVITPTLKENLLGGLVIGVKGIAQHDFVHQILLVQNRSRGGNLIGFGWGDHTAQKPARGVHRIDNLYSGMTHFLAIDNDDLVLRGP